MSFEKTRTQHLQNFNFNLASLILKKLDHAERHDPDLIPDIQARLEKYPDVKVMVEKVKAVREDPAATKELAENYNKFLQSTATHKRRVDAHNRKKIPTDYRGQPYYEAPKFYHTDQDLITILLVNSLLDDIKNDNASDEVLKVIKDESLRPIFHGYEGGNFGGSGAGGGYSTDALNRDKENTSGPSSTEVNDHSSRHSVTENFWENTETVDHHRHSNHISDPEPTLWNQNNDDFQINNNDYQQPDSTDYNYTND